MKLEQRLCPAHAVAHGPRESCPKCVEAARALVPPACAEPAPAKPPEVRVEEASPRQIEITVQIEAAPGFTADAIRRVVQEAVDELRKKPAPKDGLCAICQAPDFVPVRNERGFLIGMLTWSVFLQAYRKENPTACPCCALQRNRMSVHVSWVGKHYKTKGTYEEITRLYRAPVHKTTLGGRFRPKGSISWFEFKEAFRFEFKEAFRHQTCDPREIVKLRENIALEGGFSYERLTELLGRSPKTWEALSKEQDAVYCPCGKDVKEFKPKPLWVAEGNSRVGLLPWKHFVRAYQLHKLQYPESPHCIRCSVEDSISMQQLKDQLKLTCEEVANLLRAPVKELGTIAWWEFERAHSQYRMTVPGSLSILDVAVNGGFHLSELKDFLGYSPRTYTHPECKVCEGSGFNVDLEACACQR